VRAGEIALHALIGGADPPLLLLGGWPQYWYIWCNVMVPLARQFTVIVPDPRSLDISDKPDGGYDTGTMGRDLFDLMSGLGHERFEMVGYDRGMRTG